MIEMLVVLSIILILAGLLVRVATFATLRSQQNRARAELQMIANGLEEYRAMFGNYPVSDVLHAHTTDIATNKISAAWVQALWQRPQIELNRPPFIRIPQLTGMDPDDYDGQPFLDPWGNDYMYYRSAAAPYTRYNNPGSRFAYDLWSYGHGVPSISDTSQWITNWRNDF